MRPRLVNRDDAVSVAHRHYLGKIMARRALRLLAKAEREESVFAT